MLRKDLEASTVERQPININTDVAEYGAIASPVPAHVSARSRTQILAEISKLLLRKTGRFLLHTANCILIEGPEGGFILYNGYSLIVYFEKLKGRWGYGVVGTGALITASAEAFFIFHVLSDEKYEKYRHLKHAIAGAMDAANFFQGFMPANGWGIAGGLTVAATLATGKTLLEIYHDHPRMRSTWGRRTNFLANSFYHLATGAGIAALGLYIYSGYENKNPPQLVDWFIILPVATLNLGANIVRHYKQNSESIPFTYALAHVVSAFLYGALIVAFSIIMLSDLIMDVHHDDDDIKKKWFIAMFVSSGVLGILVALKKAFLDMKEEYRRAEPMEELHGILPRTNVLPDRSVVRRFAEKCQNAVVAPVTKCWANFWEDEQERERQTLIATIRQGYQPEEEGLPTLQRASRTPTF